MRSVFTCTTLAIIVPLVFSQRPLAHYPENLKRAVPHHYKNDQENTHRGLDKIARWHKIEPPLPRLRPHQTVPWLRWVQGRWAAPADKNTELHKVRAHLLEEKLKPNHLVFKPHINPQLKPKLNKKENVRTKREVGKTEKETPQKETHVEVNVRHKRDLMMPQLVPEMVLQPHIQANIPQPRDQFEGEIKESEKREKRQILYFINRPPKLLARSPRTTPNPFIRDTHIEEYDIIRPEVGEREGMIPTIESGSSDLGSYPLVKIPQALFRFLQIAKIKIQQNYLTKTKLTDKSDSVKEEAHVRVKRRMSRFVRDRKQMTRKKKIGRAKKTKVKRTPVKVRKWYDKRQKVKKKGDGTYRGGRGRKPRQHKRPRHYKPPMNETSDYDYYDSKGGIRGEEKQEGPDVADYLSYVSGEYADTEEAERAHQELEKEYQEQLKLVRQEGLSNRTIESLKERNRMPSSESRERKKYSAAENRGKEERAGGRGQKITKVEKNRQEERSKGSTETEISEESERSLSMRKKYKTEREHKESLEKSTSEESEEESVEEDTSGEDSSEEDSSEEDSIEEESSLEASTKEDTSDEGSSDKEGSEDSSGGGKPKKFPRKYRKSPRWKQGKVGKHESDPKKLQNHKDLIHKVDTIVSVQSEAHNKYTTSKKERQDEEKYENKEKSAVSQQQKLKSLSRKQASANVRKTARKFNFFSLSSYPIIRNFVSAGESHFGTPQRISMNPNEGLPPNRISSLRFETPRHIDIQQLQSMSLKPPPDAASLTIPHIVSKRGEHIQNLQSKRTENSLQSIFKEREPTSIAHEKPKDTLTFISETTDERNKWTSTGTDNMKGIQSLKVDPVVLTSLAKNVPEIKIDKKVTKETLMKDKENKNIDIAKTDLQQKFNKKERNHLRGSSVLTSIGKDIPKMNIDEQKSPDFIKENVNKDNIGNYFTDKNVNVEFKQEVHNAVHSKTKYQVVKEKKISKRDVNQEEHEEMSYEEISSIPDSAEGSIPSDEIESASDDKK